ncbi:ribonuclease P protein subunit p29 isoform X3 [Nilaparvata lugens]|uniref:ribonuclease P protein subunit p29 isoform X3 n=1 Tax=Nilaparvata lugens TaxID=108931 RepID=UPI00193D396D|nr:ribonuclease P protein subunit p29 isoform X3 [Nilaparvata lugens]
MTSVKKVLKKLPGNILPGQDEGPSENVDIEKIVKKVISNPVLNQEVGKELDKTFSLAKLQMKRKETEEQKQQKERDRKCAGLSNGYRRKCRIHVLPKKGLKFKDFHTVHSMWCSYIKEMLGNSLQNVGLPGQSAKQLEEISTNICKADLVGAYITVTRSRDVGCIGTEGYVAVETKNVFQILGKDNRVRTIPKRTTEFVLKLEGYRFKFLGKYFCLRSSERSARKLRIPVFDDL